MSIELLTRDSLAERGGGVVDYISPSRLNLWLKCPLQFRLKYVDQVVTPTGASMFVGKVVHSALESYYRHRQLGVTLESADVARRLLDWWEAMAVEENVTFASAAEEEASCKQAVELVAVYLTQIPADEPKPLAVEAAIEAPLVDPMTDEDLGIPLVGVLDLVLADSAGPLIVDFKTVARGGKPLEITHEIQLTSYSYLYRSETGQLESALEIRNLVKTKVPRVEAHRYVARIDRHFRRLLCVIRAYLDSVCSDRFIFRPGLHCSSCVFRNSFCRSWGG